jgi:hypothetical protein
MRRCAGLAGAHDVVQRLHRLLDRRARVPPVDLVEVDVVGAQAAQAGVDLEHDGLARQPAPVGPLAHHAVHLGGQHHFFTPGEVVQRPPDDLLAGAVGVDVGGVEEVDARFDAALDERPALLLVERPGVGAAVGNAVAHAAEADGRDVEAGGAELDVLHAATLRATFAGADGQEEVAQLSSLSSRQLADQLRRRVAAQRIHLGE